MSNLITSEMSTWRRISTCLLPLQLVMLLSSRITVSVFSMILKSDDKEATLLGFIYVEP